jgi:mycothiol synthase
MSSGPLRLSVSPVPLARTGTFKVRIVNARVEIRERLADDEVPAVLSVVEAATEADGVRPLNEHVMLHLRYGGDPGARAVLIYDDARLTGFAHLDPTDPVEGPSGELVIHPEFRGRGLGRRLLEAILADSGGRLRLWAHGDHPAAGRLAAALGLARVRSLWQMRRSLFAPLPTATMPDGVRLRTFVPGQDEVAWVTLNALAFAAHPEQGTWTLDDLKRREQEPWFDPDGFFLAIRADAPAMAGGTPDGSGGDTPAVPEDTPADSGSSPAIPGDAQFRGRESLAGFHWTKVHGHGGHGHEPIGEVYVVGVHPAEQGTGLGRALTLAGLTHLRARGLAQVMLYVDESNTAAIRLYESLGFTHWDTDVMYHR